MGYWETERALEASARLVAALRSDVLQASRAPGTIERLEIVLQHRAGVDHSGGCQRAVAIEAGRSHGFPRVPCSPARRGHRPAPPVPLHCLGPPLIGRPAWPASEAEAPDEGRPRPGQVVGPRPAGFSTGRASDAEEMLAACQAEVGDAASPWTLAAAGAVRGRLLLAMGEAGRAEELLREPVRTLARLRDRIVIGTALAQLGAAAALRSDAGRAARLFGAADAIHERIGAAPWPWYRDLPSVVEPQRSSSSVPAPSRRCTERAGGSRSTTWSRTPPRTEAVGLSRPQPGGAQVPAGGDASPGRPSSV
jgi:hypothetical protein